MAVPRAGLIDQLLKCSNAITVMSIIIIWHPMGWWPAH
jgi:hypothetical protein